MLNAFPPIDYTLQRTTRAVYCLVRGIGTPLDERSAQAVAFWLTEKRNISIDRHGPSRFPGPDGTQYEWFFRVKHDPNESASIDDLYDRIHGRLFVATSRSPLAVEEPVLSSQEAGEDAQFSALTGEIARTEVARLTSYLNAEIQRLHRALSVRLREIVRLRSAPVQIQTESPPSVSDRTVVDSLLEEVALRETAVAAREEQVSDRERDVAAETSHLEFLRLEVNEKRAQLARLGDLRQLLPRIDMDPETDDILHYELNHSEAYVRFLSAMQDHCDIGNHPQCLKHEKVKGTKAKNLWEIRLRNSVSDDYRLYYRQVDNDKLQVWIRHKKDQQKFFASF